MKKKMIIGLFFVFLQILTNASTTTNMKKNIIFLTALFAIIVAGCGRNTPDHAVDMFYKATQAHDYAKALEYSNLENGDREYLIAYLEKMGMVIHEYEVLGSNIDEGDTTATVYLHIVSSNKNAPDSLENELNVSCVKRGNKWKVKF